MTTKKTLQKQLVESSGKMGQQANTPQPSNFIQKLLYHHDGKIAADLAGQQAGLTFDGEYVAESEQLKLELQDITARYKKSDQLLNELEDTKRQTKRYIKISNAQKQNPKDKIRWKDWQSKDQALLIFVLTCLPLSLFMGAANVYSNLLSSGVAIFIEQKSLAIFLSALLPIGAAAIKFVTNFMKYDQSRRYYVQGVFALTVITLIVWSVVFSLNYSGVSSGIDWESFGEDNAYGSILVWTQLFAELLVSSALFLVAEDIYLRYAPPDNYIENPEYSEINNALIAHQKEHEILCEKRGQKHGRIVSLQAARQSYINEHIADYLAMRARYDAANNFNV